MEKEIPQDIKNCCNDRELELYKSCNLTYRWSTEKAFYELHGNPFDKIYLLFTNSKGRNSKVELAWIFGASDTETAKRMCSPYYIE